MKLEFKRTRSAEVSAEVNQSKGVGFRLFVLMNPKGTQRIGSDIKGVSVLAFVAKN